jgi:DNA-binding transcriptional LysR family regulator
VPKRVDLQQVVVLHALLEERSVTRAAARLGVTQSAVSHALKRLRTRLRDPLLVRTSEGTVLTPRAEALLEPIAVGLDAIEGALDRVEPFDPHVRRAFTIVATDLLGVVLLPPLFERVSAEAPGVDLRVRSLVKGSEVGLASNDVDLLLTGVPTEAGGLVQQRLLEDEFACVVRRGHPAADAMTLERFCASPHVLVSPLEGRGAVDKALAERGLSRRVAARVPHFAVAPFLVARSDAILTTPKRHAQLVASQLRLRVLTPPIELPRARWWQIWHERRRHDPAHAWLRALVAAVASTV